MYTPSNKAVKRADFYYKHGYLPKRHLTREVHFIDDQAQSKSIMGLCMMIALLFLAICALCWVVKTNATAEESEKYQFNSEPKITIEEVQAMSIMQESQDKSKNTQSTANSSNTNKVNNISSTQPISSKATITEQDGIYYYNGKKETYYSSNVLRHYRTSEWYVDSEGFYHNEDGYYVVASEDYPKNTIVKTSKGNAIVLDCGCLEGVIDFYVNW